jgi:hypothetical protein
MTHTPPSNHTTTSTNPTTPCRLRQLDMRGCMTPTTTTDDDEERQSKTEAMLLSACQQNCTLQLMSVAMNAEHRAQLNEYLKRNYYLMHGQTLAQKAVAEKCQRNHRDEYNTSHRRPVSPQVMYWAWNELRQRDQGATAAFDLFRNVILCPP